MHSKLAAEEAVLGSILLENPTLFSVCSLLDPEDFSVTTYANIYRAMVKLGNASKPIDATTLVTEGFDVSTVMDLMETVATAANIEHYADIVKDGSQKRKLSAASAQIQHLAVSDAPAAECVAEAEKRILAIRHTETMGDTYELGAVGKEVYELVEQRMAEGGNFFGHRTGFTELDDALGGMQNGETLVLAGRPSMGKSSVAAQILLNRAKEGASCAFFSLEMSRQMCTMRMMSQLSGVPMSKIKSGRLTPKGLERIRKTKDDMQDYKIFVGDKGDISVPEIRSVCRRLKARAGHLDLVVVDYLQLCGGTGRDGRERDVAEASSGLKAIAKEFELPVIILSQLNRSCEARDDKRPRLSDLRESGAIEQDADSVVMVYRPFVYSPSSDEGEIELIIRKNRNGPLGTAAVSWHPESMSVTNC